MAVATLTWRCRVDEMGQTRLMRVARAFGQPDTRAGVVTYVLLVFTAVLVAWALGKAWWDAIASDAREQQLWRMIREEREVRYGERTIRRPAGGAAHGSVRVPAEDRPQRDDAREHSPGRTPAELPAAGDGGF
jgi:hypothetical protein